MIYEVKVRVVQEGTVFVEAKTQDEAKKAATRDSSEIEIIKAEDVLGKRPDQPTINENSRGENDEKQ